MNVRIQYQTTFAAGVSFEGTLIMNNYNLRVWLNTNTDDPANHNIAFERLKYFIAELDSNIFINDDEVEICEKYLNAGLRITTLPGDPVDQIIGIMLFYKLNAIMEDRVSVLETELSSTMSDGITYMHCENEQIDLETIPEWWITPDLVHHDFATNDSVLTIHRSSAWRDLDLGWPATEDTSEATEDDAESGNTVVFADFNRTDKTDETI